MPRSAPFDLHDWNGDVVGDTKRTLVDNSDILTTLKPGVDIDSLVGKKSDSQIVEHAPVTSSTLADKMTKRLKQIKGNTADGHNVTERDMEVDDEQQEDQETFVTSSKRRNLGKKMRKKLQQQRRQATQVKADYDVDQDFE